MLRLLFVRTTTRRVASLHSSALLHNSAPSAAVGGAVGKSSTGPKAADGVWAAPVTFRHSMEFFGDAAEAIPAYQVMDMDGQVVKATEDPMLPAETLLKMYKTMVELFNTDQILYDLQRQGAISFYMTAYGEYATHVGPAAAIKPTDIVFGQYREAGVLMYRGFTIQDICNQCYSNVYDVGKGRQMPVHYGSRAFNFHTISSPLATQIPQAVGTAYAHRYLLGNKDHVSLCYFGDGSASEGDFHAALNFSATLETPTIFFCRNNGYAISTPIREQFRGDGIAARGPGYGIRTIRVDGNDALACYRAVAAAREQAIRDGRPILIEAMTYRIGHHSTSDDSTRYRAQGEIDNWNKTNNPIRRMRRYLERRGLWDESQDLALNKASRQAVLTAMRAAENAKKPSISEMFTDVYDSVPKQLAEQQAALRDHLARHPDAYPVEHYATKE